MVRYTGTVLTKQPLQRVWTLVSDWTRLADWDVNVKAMKPIAGTPARGLGAEWQCAFEFKGRKTDAKYKCVEWDEDSDAKRAVFEATSTFVRSKDTVTVVERDGATEVTTDFQLYFRGLLAPLSFFLDGAMQETGPLVMKDLEAFIDKELK